MPRTAWKASSEREAVVAAADPGEPAAQAFASFPARAAAALRAAAAHRIWRDGDVLLPKGCAASSVMSIVRGRARVEATPSAGQEVFVRWQMPGEMVGLVSAISGLPLPVDVVAVDNCETLQVDRDVLLEILRADAEAALAAAVMLAGHAYDLIHLLTARSEQIVTARVLGTLRHLAMLNGRPHDGDARVLAISQWDIASAVGASRTRVNAELRALERAGLIELGYRRIVVHGIGRSVPAAKLRERR